MNFKKRFTLILTFVTLSLSLVWFTPEVSFAKYQRQFSSKKLVNTQNQIEILETKRVSPEQVSSQRLEAFGFSSLPIQTPTPVGINQSRLNHKALKADIQVDQEHLQGWLPDIDICGYTMYKVTYPTQDHRGQATRSSGLIVVPWSAADSALSVISYQHGTITGGNNIPSNLAGDYAYRLGLIFGGTCFITVASDYVGLGENKGFHPFLHQATEGKNTKDLLLALEPFLKSQGYQMGDQLFMWGHSQGGHVTLALQKSWEADPTAYNSNLHLTAVVAASSPADLSGAALSSMTKPSAHTTAYGAFIAYSMNKIYGVFNSTKAMIREPWADQLDTLFNGDKELWFIASLLPTQPAQLFQDAFFTELTSANKSSSFLRVLELNNSYNFKPKTQLRLYHGHGDQDVPIANSEKAYQAFRSMGLSEDQVELIDLGNDVDHKQGYVHALIRGLYWFLTLR